eukprot:CAMPEP_0115855364 /NCGR_PEP_ID=MMETSP0287-20121206/14503_1 /TAXON_ID=412157 /ORGANISM="Chrysochromulina rotalis, Strain UIO044" /LENGTH=68 /DNA_ID=CAMNT_0003309513 /DNA_START=93 /DNA_END=297 /DNA_ORIENTATION=-
MVGGLAARCVQTAAGAALPFGPELGTAPAQTAPQGTAAWLPGTTTTQNAHRGGTRLASTPSAYTRRPL